MSKSKEWGTCGKCGEPLRRMNVDGSTPSMCLDCLYAYYKRILDVKSPETTVTPKRKG
jgi:hypothetical protein